MPLTKLNTPDYAGILYITILYMLMLVGRERPVNWNQVPPVIVSNTNAPVFL